MLRKVFSGTLGRSRIILLGIAAIAVVGGLILAGEMQPTNLAPGPVATPITTGLSAATPAPATAQTNSVSAPAAGQSGDLSVRDYSAYSAAPAADLPSSDFMGSVADMGIKLVLVLGVIYVGFRVYKHYFLKGKSPATSRKPVALLGTLNLPPNRSVYVLEVGRKVLVVGGTQSQLSLLTEVTDPEAMDEVRALAAETPAVQQFSSLFNVAKRQFKGKPLPEAIESSLPPLSGTQGKLVEGRNFLQDRLSSIRHTAGSEGANS
jgi:flagellar biogenesis protein FliO